MDRKDLETRAEALGVTFAANISDAKLAERVNAAEAATQTRPEDVLRVIGPPSGHRRAGRRFGPEPVDLILSELSSDDLKALQCDPRLMTLVMPPE